MLHLHYKLLKWLTLYREVIALECEHHMKHIKTLCKLSARVYMYRVIRNDCRGFNNLSYTIHLR